MAVAFILFSPLILVIFLVVFDYKYKIEGLFLDLVRERYAVALAPLDYTCTELVSPASNAIARLSSGTVGATFR